MTAGPSMRCAVCLQHSSGKVSCLGRLAPVRRSSVTGQQPGGSCAQAPKQTGGQPAALGV
eukprot:9662183-Lingulodinium_polyedra.AAC.1